MKKFYEKKKFWAGAIAILAALGLGSAYTEPLMKMLSAIFNFGG